jgi:hypothetical protein
MQERPVFGVGTSAGQESGTAAERDPADAIADVPFDFPDMQICGTAHAWIRRHSDGGLLSAGPEPAEPADTP